MLPVMRPVILGDDPRLTDSGAKFLASVMNMMGCSDDELAQRVTLMLSHFKVCETGTPEPVVFDVYKLQLFVSREMNLTCGKGSHSKSLQLSKRFVFAIRPFSSGD